MINQTIDLSDHHGYDKEMSLKFYGKLKTYMNSTKAKRRVDGRPARAQKEIYKFAINYDRREMTMFYIGLLAPGERVNKNIPTDLLLIAKEIWGYENN